MATCILTYMLIHTYGGETNKQNWAQEHTLGLNFPTCLPKLYLIS